MSASAEVPDTRLEALSIAIESSKSESMSSSAGFCLVEAEPKGKKHIFQS
jgi:hypothetical protein